jgi:D-tyrosyl-tRNA(Tyr) deacylase
MKLVIQRVKKAKVTVGQKVVGEIGQGLFVLVGVKKGDTKSAAEILAEKLVKLRIMSDENNKMNLSIKDVKGEVLVVSQFTLHADTSGGNRPSFINAEDPAKAKEIYEHFVGELRASGLNIQTGNFGAYMEIEMILDGPVTVTLES